MTAKHRGRGKGSQNGQTNNHKNHEDNFFSKQDGLDGEPEPSRGGGSSSGGGGHHYTLLFILFLMIIVTGGSASWFCFQQHQTISFLTDNLTAMQLKVVRLQAAHEEVRRSSDKGISDGLENRLNDLEQSYSLAQKQVGMALATAEQLKSSDLPAQVLSLHTEMKTRLQEMQHTAVSMETMEQMQAALRAKSEEFEGVRLQVEGLAALSAELSQNVETLTSSLRVADYKLEEKSDLVLKLSSTLIQQAAQLVAMKEQLEQYKTHLDTSSLEMTAVRATLRATDLQKDQQDIVEEHLNTVRLSLEEQSSSAHAVEEQLSAQLDSIQKELEQVEEVAAASPQEEEESVSKDEVAPAAEEEEAVPVSQEEESRGEEAVPVSEEEELGGEEEAVPVSEEESIEEEDAVPVSEEEERGGEGSEPPAEEEVVPATEEEGEEAVPVSEEEESAGEEVNEEVPEEVPEVKEELHTTEEENHNAAEQQQEEQEVSVGETEELVSEGEAAVEEETAEEVSAGEPAVEEETEKEDSEQEQVQEETPVEEEESVEEEPLEEQEVTDEECK